MRCVYCMVGGRRPGACSVALQHHYSRPVRCCTSGVCAPQLQSIKLDPTDGTILYVLGYFEYSVASMGFATRAVASALFGSPPKVHAWPPDKCRADGRVTPHRNITACHVAHRPRLPLTTTWLPLTWPTGLVRASARAFHVRRAHRCGRARSTTTTTVPSGASLAGVTRVHTVCGSIQTLASTWPTVS